LNEASNLVYNVFNVSTFVDVDGINLLPWHSALLGKLDSNADNILWKRLLSLLAVFEEALLE